MGTALKREGGRLTRRAGKKPTGARIMLADRHIVGAREAFFRGSGIHMRRASPAPFTPRN